VKITDVEIDGFGVWSGLRLSNLGEPLVVFYGPNEAGKSTLMQFVRTVLYGFSNERRNKYLPPVAGGRPGGWLRVNHFERSLTIRRRADGDDPAGDAMVVDRHGVEQGDLKLRDLLGEIDEPVFNHVFALGLREIQELGTLSDTEASHLLYDLTLGLDRVSLVDVLRELSANRNKLLAADDRPSLIVQLLGQKERLQSEIDELHGLMPKYLELVQTRNQVARDVDDDQAQLDALAKKLHVYEIARSLTHRWRNRTMVDQQIKALGPIVTLADGAVDRLDRLNERMQARRDHLSEIKKQSDQLKGEADALQINEKLCQRAPRLEALSEQQQWIASLAEQVKQIETEVAGLENQRKAGDERWGLAGPKNSNAPPIDPARHMAALTAAAKSLRDARNNYKKARTKAIEGKETATQITDRIESTLGKKNEEGLETSLDRATKLVAQLKKRVQIEQRQEQMQRHLAAVEEEGRQWLSRQVLTAEQATGVGFLFILGSGLFLLWFASKLMPASMGDSFQWPIGMLGMVLAGAGGLAKVMIEQYSGEQLESNQQQVVALRDQIEEVKREGDAIEAQLPKGTGPFVTRLHAAEADLTSLEDLVPMESNRKSLRRENRAARQQTKSVRNEYQKARGRWVAALKAAGLSEKLSPRELGDYRRHHEQIRDLVKQLDSRKQDLAERKREYLALTSRITQLVSEAGIKTSSTEPLAQMREMLLQLQEHDTRFKRRETLLAEVTKLRKRKNRSERALDKLRGQRSLILRAADAADEAEFRRFAEVQQEAKKLNATRVQLTVEINAALAGQCSEEAVARYLDGGVSLDRIGEDLTSTQAQIKTRLAQLFERRGELNQQIKTLVEDRRLENKRVELALVEEKLREALEKWRTLAVSDVILERVRAFYEREHQPVVLREASGYLQKLTSGRYTRVWTPMGKHILHVDGSDGVALPVDMLSRGTREQIFLSLRLALVNAYATRGLRLPLVLDDVLVNFDAGRAKAAANVLRDYAKNGHQLLIFTCHEHIARMFKGLKAEVRELPDNSRPPRAYFDPDEEEKKVRRRPEPEPIPLPVVEPEPVVAEPVMAVEEIIIHSPVAATLPTILIEPPRIELPEPPAPEPEPEPPRFAVPKFVVPAPPEVVPPEPVVAAKFSVPPTPKPAPKPVAPKASNPVLIVSKPSTPKPMAPRRRPRPPETFRNDWNAEEFDGELADRVRPDLADADGIEAS